MSLTECQVTAGPAISTDTGAAAGAGDKVKVDLSIPHNARLARDGRLVELKAKPKSRPKPKTEE